MSSTCWIHLQSVFHCHCHCDHALSVSIPNVCPCSYALAPSFHQATFISSVNGARHTCRLPVHFSWHVVTLHMGIISFLLCHYRKIFFQKKILVTIQRAITGKYLWNIICNKKARDSTAALGIGTDGATAAVVSSEHKVANASRNKQLSTSHHFPAIISLRYPSTQLFKFFDPIHSAISFKPRWLASSAAHHVSMGIA